MSDKSAGSKAHDPVEDEPAPETRHSAAKKSAFDQTVEEAVKVGPLSLLWTVRLVFASVKEHETTLTDAIGKQDWSEVVSPQKYFVTCLAIAAAMWASLRNFLKSQFPKIPQDIPDLQLPLVLCIGIAFAVFIHFIYDGKALTGTSEGLD